jgi:hypothetical protein
MVENDFDLAKKFKGLENQEKFFLYACIVSAIGYILPWFSVPILGNINGLRGWGAALFILTLITAGLMFYKPKYAAISGFAVGGLLIWELINLMSIDSGSEISIFNFAGIGLYLTYIGAIAMIFFGIGMLKKGGVSTAQKLIIGGIILLIILGFVGTKGVEWYNGWQNERAMQKESEVYQQQSNIDAKLLAMENKLQNGIEVNLVDYWDNQTQKSFKQNMNTKLAIPVDFVGTLESKEDDIRIFNLGWIKAKILNNQGQIKADFISSLKTAVEEIKSTNKFEIVNVYIFENNSKEEPVGSITFINTAKVNENTDYSQIIAQQGEGIFQR